MGPIDGELPALVDLWMEIQTVIAGDSVLQSQHVRSAEWLSGLTEPTIITHGDVRPENALVVGERVILLDFDEPTLAWPAYDLARMMVDDEAAPPSDPPTHRSTMRAGYGRARPDYLWSSDEIARFLGIRALLMYGWSLQDRSAAGTIWMRRLRAILEQPLERLQ
jgi:Ser/Thr protein kinase RdoA (MazF antagonist)